jgi:glycosyltransferase involved in cell wall biosynthesis
MMLGTPIIVAKGTNIDRIVETYHNGVVVRYGNIEDLENALLLLSKDPTLKGKLGENARRAYDEVYGWEKMRSRLIALYDNLPPLLPTGKTDI